MKSDLLNADRLQRYYLLEMLQKWCLEYTIGKSQGAQLLFGSNKTDNLNIPKNQSDIFINASECNDNVEYTKPLQIRAPFVPVLMLKFGWHKEGTNRLKQICLFVLVSLLWKRKETRSVSHTSERTQSCILGILLLQKLTPQKPFH